MIRRLSMGALVLGLVTIAGSQEANAAPSNVTVSQFHGLVGEAHFGNQVGCVLTFVHVVGVENRTRSVGSPANATEDVTVEYTVFDICSGAFTFGSGSATGDIRGNLRQLSLHADIPVIDTILGNTTVGVNVNFTRNGNGPDPTVDTTHTTTPTSFMVVHSLGRTVPATAAGSVVLAGDNLIAGLTDPAAHIDDIKTGTITITRP